MFHGDAGYKYQLESEASRPSKSVRISVCSSNALQDTSQKQLGRLTCDVVAAKTYIASQHHKDACFRRCPMVDGSHVRSETSIPLPLLLRRPQLMFLQWQLKNLSSTTKLLANAVDKDIWDIQDDKPSYTRRGESRQHILAIVAVSQCALFCSYASVSQVFCDGCEITSFLVAYVAP